MQIGFIQPPYQAESGSVVETVEFVFEALASARGGLVVMPEYANCPGVSDPAELAQLADADAFLGRVSAAARRRGVAVAANVLQRLDGRLSNVTWFFDATGEARSRYVKTHLSVHERDTLRLAPGEEAVTIDWDGVRVGFLTCFDIYFAEFVERLAALRPDVVVFPSYQRSEPGEVLVRQAAGRALDLEAYVVRASYAMGDTDATGGHSLVAAPDGSILKDAGQVPGLHVVTVEPRAKRMRPVAHGLPTLTSRRIVEENRRPWLYRPAGPAAVSTVGAGFPRVVAHRGLSEVCPENTLPAFAAAVALGAEEIELDLWASKDGELVVCHDKDVARTSNGQGRIGDLTWAQIRALDAGAWHAPAWAGVPFCRLDDVLDACGGCVVMNIHLKEPGHDGLVVRRTRELAAARGLLDDIYITGDTDVLDWALKVAPDVARCSLAHPTSGAHMLDSALKYRCERVQFWNPNFTAADIARAHEHDITCNLFFGDRPDTPDEATRLCALGLDAILTNRANTVLPAVRGGTPQSRQ